MSMGNGSSGQHPPQTFYPDLAHGLGRLIKDCQMRQQKTTHYFYLQNQILIELGNFALDVAESMAQHNGFDPAMLRHRVDILNGLIDQAPVPQAIPQPVYQQPPPQNYQMREVLDRAGYEGNGNGAYDPSHGPYPYPEQFTR